MCRVHGVVTPGYGFRKTLENRILNPQRKGSAAELRRSTPLPQKLLCTAPFQGSPTSRSHLDSATTRLEDSESWLIYFPQLHSALRADLPSHCWIFMRSPQERLREPGRATGLDLSPPTDLSFEYAVAVRKGKGKASFSDLYILTDKVAVAVEAKYKEPMYEDVGTFLGNPIKDNRKSVLEGWLEIIAQTTGCSLLTDDILDLPYQLIHRTASACSASSPEHAVIYLVFGEGSAISYEKPIRALAELLRSAPRMRFALVECGLDKQSAFTELEDRWKRKDDGIGDAVRNAIRMAPCSSSGVCVP